MNELGLREKKKLQTRVAIMKEAGRLFQEKGFFDTTIREIAESANVSERTFYRYFESKEELLFSNLKEVLAKFIQNLKIIPMSSDPIVAIKFALNETLEDSPPNLSQIRKFIGSSTIVDVHKELLGIIFNWESSLAQEMEGRARYLEPEGNSLDLKIWSLVLARAIFGAARTALNISNDTAATSRERNDLIRSTFDKSLTIMLSGFKIPTLKTSAIDA